MNYKKVNSLALKAYYAKDGHKTVYGKYEGKIGIVDHGHRVLLIAEKEFIFDLDKLLAKYKKEPIDLSKILVKDFNTEPATISNDLKTLDEFTVIKIRGEKADAWINKKYLEEFNKDAEFRVVYSTRRNNEPYITMVYVMEFGEIVGALLPVNIKED